MNIPQMQLLVAESEGGEISLKAPSVGSFVRTVQESQLLSAGGSVGIMSILNRRYRLVVPEGVAGRVASVRVPKGRSGLGYGDVICELQIGAVDAADISAPTGAMGLPDLPENAEIFRAPIEGQFYRRPSPDESPFADVGDLIASGDRLGLAEVMKFFHPVVFDGPSERRIERFLAEDGEPVDSGAPLVVLIPAQ